MDNEELRARLVLLGFTPHLSQYSLTKVLILSNEHAYMSVQLPGLFVFPITVHTLSGGKKFYTAKAAWDYIYNILETDK